MSSFLEILNLQSVAQMGQPLDRYANIGITHIHAAQQRDPLTTFSILQFEPDGARAFNICLFCFFINFCKL